MDSTWAVCGNISITPALVSRYPYSLTKRSASRAREPGWHDTYTIRPGVNRAIRGRISKAPERG